MPRIAIIGGGPAGLVAADRRATAGHAVTLFDRMPSPGRKFLMAGRGGLNLTHSEPLERFLARYPDCPEALEKAIRAFPPDALRDFAAELGQRT
ncbi:MAG: NAD(P)/FAD-dependent oxidoreductase, partial [Methylobacterium sp.]|nr:NAD(P)/FAD-dependent oxidoreductase [Methylobacterium sp.]